MTGSPETVSTAKRCGILFRSFFKISAVTLGGGLSMLPVMEEEFVRKRAWLTQEDMVDTIAVVQSMPGIIAANMAVMIGVRSAKVRGAISAVLGAALPPFLVILVIAMLFRTISGSAWVAHIFLGVRSAICALILLAAIRLGQKILKGLFPWIIAICSFSVLTFVPQINAVWVIIFGGFAGILMSLLNLQKQKKTAERKE